MMRTRLRRPVLLATMLAGLLSAGVSAVAAAPGAPEPAALGQAARAFVERIRSGELAALPDDELIQAFKQQEPEVFASYLELGAQSLNEYEMWMRREERLASGWTERPFLNYIKYRHQPRRVYMKWLKGGAKAGQEILFDEGKRKDAMYGHLGGLLNVMSVWTPLDSAMARDNSRHTVNDLGMQSIVAIVVAERALYLAQGHRPYPDRIEVGEAGGQRTVALTWVAPPSTLAGPQRHYAKKTKVYLDLKQPWIRQIESWDDDGELIERILLDKIVPATFTDADFDPGNKAYAF